MHSRHIKKVEAVVSTDGEATRAIVAIPLKDTVSVLFAPELRKETDSLLSVDLELSPGDGSMVEVAAYALEAGHLSFGLEAHKSPHAAIPEEHSMHTQLICVLRRADGDQLSDFTICHT